MERRDAVDGHAARDAEVRHTHRAVPDDGHFLRLFRVVVELLHLLLPAVGDLLNDLPRARQQLLKQALRPALERLGQHRVVRVGHGVRRDVPRLLP